MAPAHTVTSGWWAMASRSADTSPVTSAPRWTPPIPPVANTATPAAAASASDADTVVAPSVPALGQGHRHVALGRLAGRAEDARVLVVGRRRRGPRRRARPSPPAPRRRPGSAPMQRSSASALAGDGSPRWEKIVDSSATTARRRRQRGGDLGRTRPARSRPQSAVSGGRTGSRPRRGSCAGTCRPARSARGRSRRAASSLASRPSDAASQLTSTMHRRLQPGQRGDARLAEPAAGRVGEHDVDLGAGIGVPPADLAAHDAGVAVAEVALGVGARRARRLDGDQRAQSGRWRRRRASRRRRRRRRRCRRRRSSGAARRTASTSSSAACGPDWKNEPIDTRSRWPATTSSSTAAEPIAVPVGQPVHLPGGPIPAGGQLAGGHRRRATSARPPGRGAACGSSSASGGWATRHAGAATTSWVCSARKPATPSGPAATRTVVR